MAEFASLRDYSASSVTKTVSNPLLKTTSFLYSPFVRLKIASASTTVSSSVLATLILAALLGAAAESADGAVSGVVDRAGDSGELQGIAMAAKVITILSGRSRRELREDLGGLLSGASNGERDEEEKGGGELHVEDLKWLVGQERVK